MGVATIMEPATLQMCHSCGAVCRIEKVLRLTTAPPRYCTYCGADTLQTVKSSFPGLLEARCFARFDRRLVELIWQEWGASPQKMAQWPTLLGYLTWRIENA